MYVAVICSDLKNRPGVLSPYSYDEGCLSSSQDHIPLAALPLLATSAPQYQDAVATVIVRANQVYGDFIKSLEGAAFSGQVCLIGDCVGGILGFDALCSSNQTVSESQNSSRRGSVVSVQLVSLAVPAVWFSELSWCPWLCQHSGSLSSAGVPGCASTLVLGAQLVSLAVPALWFSELSWSPWLCQHSGSLSSAGLPGCASTLVLGAQLVSLAVPALWFSELSWSPWLCQCSGSRSSPRLHGCASALVLGAQLLVSLAVPALWFSELSWSPLLGPQDTELLSPGIIINCSGASPLEGSRHLSRSNIDIPRSSAPDDSKKQLPRKRSDSSTYELDTIKQHQAFLSSLHSSVLRNDASSRRSSNSTMLDGGGLGKFDFEVSDFFLFGSPLGLVLALRKTVIPSLDITQLRPACQQVYNLFHPADPSASRLEPLLEKKFHLLPPFSVPRYQRFPLGDGNSALLVETVQNNPQLLLECGGAPSLRCPEGISETSIPVPVLNCWAAPPAVADYVVQSHGGVFVDSSFPSSPSSSRSPSPKSHRRDGTDRSPEVEGEPGCLDQIEKSSSVGSDLGVDPVSHLPSPDLQLDPEQVAARWWGTKRIDFALYCPDALTAFPTVALPHLFHASYWESTDVVSFLLRQVMRHENSSILELDGKEVSEFTPSKPREKWLRKRTHVKIRNVTANHRVNDAVFTEDGPQVVMGRFMYGPLDMVTLTGEK
ncbi:hypothetical protein JZ751_013551, partial [Albula glossodonta]